jgi:hypothetical protein
MAKTATATTTSDVGDDAPVPSTELDAIKARIEAARTVLPDDPHCLDCFRKGRDAAIKAITGES